MKPPMAMPGAESTPSTLDAWLARLEAAHPVGIDLGLERVAEVARRMGLFDGPLAGRVITVAGTNGKGSSVAMLEALARAHGLSTATYTSPHLLRYNERLRLDGVEADDATLIAGFEAVEAARSTGDPVSLTYFEVGTLGAFWAMAQRPPDLAILEVGLGGRLDAVNIVDADVAVVTTVAQDHAAFLGEDLEQIGREKAGILRAGRPAVLGSQALPASVRQVASELGAPVFALGEAFWRAQDEEGGTCHLWQPLWGQTPAVSNTHWGQTPAVSTPSPGCTTPGLATRPGSDPRGGDTLTLAGLPDPGLPLDNAATALQALALAGVTLEEGACRRALAEVRLPGRMQWLGQWCLDVGHNPHAATYVAGRLAERSGTGRTIALLGMLGDKDAEGVMRALVPVVDAWVTVSLAGERARSAEDLAGRLTALGAEVWHRAASPAAGADWLAARLSPEDRVLVCGSFFTVAEVLAWWQRSAQTEEAARSSEGTS